MAGCLYCTRLHPPLQDKVTRSYGKYESTAILLHLKMHLTNDFKYKNQILGCSVRVFAPHGEDGGSNV